MIEAKTIIRKIRGGDDYCDTLMEFGMEERLTCLGLGIQRLEEVCRIADQVRSGEREHLQGRILTLFGPVFVATRWAGNGGASGLREAISRLEEEVTAWSTETERFQVYLQFAKLVAIGKVISIDDLVDMCNTRASGIDCLKILAEGLVDTALTEPSAYLTPSGRDEFLELSLRPKGLSPEAFLLELESEMSVLKKNEDQKTIRNSIVAYSWLLDPRKQKTTKVLDRLGLGRDDGGKVTLFDPDEGIAEDEFERMKVAIAALTAIPQASVNLARFLRHGRLPFIGRLVIKAEDFWK